MTVPPPVRPAPPKWAKVIDHTRCIGCHACSTACKSENHVPIGVNRTYVKSVDVGTFPQARRAFQVTRCNQCDDAPCVTACPTSAMFRRPDGIVDFDKSACIGCKACIAACPYDAIFINPDDHSAEKCNFCAHRLDMGLEPACAVVCPTEAILVGDVHDPTSKVARIIQREAVTVRRPEKETRPKLYYKGAHQATLDPLAALRPTGGLFMWSEQPDAGTAVTSGHPHGQTSSAAAVLSYDVAHSIPWGWRVSLYTWTKGIAAGAYMVAFLLVALGVIGGESVVWTWWTPFLSMTFLGLTGALLVADLKHPARFFYIFTRPQPKSWLVRGGVVLTAYGGVLVAHLASAPLGRPVGLGALAVFGVSVAGFTAVYTAYLFAQAKARDLWQSPLLAPHFLVHAAAAGAATLAFVVTGVEPSAVGPALATVAVTSLAHLGLVVGEVTVPHPTAHARLAVHEMIGGRFRVHFWSSVALVGVGIAAPWLGVWAAAAVLVGLLAHGHAYVQAGQSVPLA